METTTTTTTTTRSGPLPYEEVFVLTFNPKKVEQVKMSISFYPNGITTGISSKQVDLDEIHTEWVHYSSYRIQTYRDIYFTP